MYAISNVMSLEPKNKLSALQPSSGKESGKASENRLLWALIDWLPIKKNVLECFSKKFQIWSRTVCAKRHLLCVNLLRFRVVWYF